MDPQKSANRIIDGLRAKKLTGRALWNMVGEFGLALKKSLAGEPVIFTEIAALGAKPASRRTTADLHKVAAILMDTADQHKALERYDGPPKSEIVKAAEDTIADLFKER